MRHYQEPLPVVGVVHLLLLLARICNYLGTRSAKFLVGTARWILNMGPGRQPPHYVVTVNYKCRCKDGDHENLS